MPSENGELSVLSGHTPLISTLKQGKIKFVTTQGNEEISINGGLSYTDGKNTLILAD
jgi:F-type H+-transporting ATPase subunit epsilon